MRPSLVLFGDSITEEAFGEGGWAACLANHYSRSADVVLRGYSGYNTRWAARVAARAVASIPGQVAAVTVCFGANDAALPDRACALQHVPLAEHTYADDCSGLQERTNLATGRYARACVDVARRCGVRAIDVWSKMQKFPGWEKTFLRDGLHLTPIGNRVLFEEVVFALKDADLGLEALPAGMPLFSDIDPENPTKSFEE